MCTTSAAVLFLAGLCLGTGPAAPSRCDLVKRRHLARACLWIESHGWALAKALATAAILAGLALALAGCEKGGTVTGPEAEPACQNVQWIVSALVPRCCTRDNPFGASYSGVVVLGPEHTRSPESRSFPFTVPAGKYLGISTVLVSSKLFDFQDGERGSYFHLLYVPLTPGLAENNPNVLILSVPTTAPYMRFSPPISVSGGHTVYADFSNAAGWEQYMSANVTGYLADDPNFVGCNFQAVVPGQNAIY